MNLGVSSTEGKESNTELIDEEDDFIKTLKLIDYYITKKL